VRHCVIRLVDQLRYLRQRLGLWYPELLHNVIGYSGDGSDLRRYRPHGVHKLRVDLDGHIALGIPEDGSHLDDGVRLEVQPRAFQIQPE